MFRLRVLMFFYFCALIPIQAQIDSISQTRTPIALGLRGHYGFIIPHSDVIKEQANSNPWGFELDAALHLISEKSWKNFTSFPRVGATLSYINFNNPEVLGSAINLGAYFEPIIAVRNRLNFSFRLGLGISYLNRVYDVETNPENQFYSSPISFLLFVNGMINYRIRPHLQARAGFFYNHISNGGIKQPNKGINFPTASLGIEYILNPYDFRARVKEDWRLLYPERFKIKMALFGTAKTLNNEDNRRFGIIGTTVYGSYVVGRMSALTAGLEWVVDYSLREKLRRENLGNDFQKGSLNIGHDLLLGKFIFSQQVGLYLYRDFFDKPFYYQRYGLSYQINPHLFAGLQLKAHGDVADFMDFRVGYVF